MKVNVKSRRAYRWANLRILAILVLVVGGAALAVTPWQQASAASGPERAAAAYLANHANELGLKQGVSDLHAEAATTTLAGSVVTYQQYAGQWPVSDAQVKVTLDSGGNVLLVVSSYKALAGSSSDKA